MARFFSNFINIPIKILWVGMTRNTLKNDRRGIWTDEGIGKPNERINHDDGIVVAKKIQG